MCVGRPGKVSILCCCGVEYTTRWVRTSGLHGTEWQTLGVTLNVGIMRRYQLGEGDLISTDIIYNIQYPVRAYYSNYIPGSLRSILTYNREVKKTASADPKTIGV